jgi:hypothetical protein
MSSFKQLLSESAKKYDFRVKIAGPFEKDNETKLESLLDKYKVSSFKKTGTTPVQSFPLDFPKLRNETVSIYEVVVDYPTTPFELTEYLTNNLNLKLENLVVRKPGEPGEEYQTPTEKRTEALLNDKDYKESPNAKFEDYYGDKYNSGFVKELNDILKLQRKARGEVIPDGSQAEMNNQEQASHSILKQAQDPRKK